MRERGGVGRRGGAGLDVHPLSFAKKKHRMENLESGVGSL